MAQELTTEEKRDKFVKLAEGRTQVALDAINKLGKLANDRAYVWTSDDIAKISLALEGAISNMKGRFDPDFVPTITFSLNAN